MALSVALALGDLLEREHGFRVVLTRDSDRDVALDDRIAAANTARADVLISIHLNASPSPAASGTLVYHLTPQAAGRAPAGSAVQFVPWSSAQAPFVPASRRLAEALASELQVLDIAAGGVADAPVRVLRGAAMPAVQVELGFVTSRRDLSRLSDPAFPARRRARLPPGFSDTSVRSAACGPRGTFGDVRPAPPDFRGGVPPGRGLVGRRGVRRGSGGGTGRSSGGR